LAPVPSAATCPGAAGIERHHPHARAGNRIQHQLHVDGFVIEVALVEQFCIRRDQPVAPARLDAVPGKIDDCDVRPVRRLLEIAQRIAHPVDLEIGQHRDRLEARLVQRTRDKLHVSLRIAQLRSARIGAIANHKRHPPRPGLRGRSRTDKAGQQQRRPRTRPPPKDAHHRSTLEVNGSEGRVGV